MPYLPPPGGGSLGVAGDDETVKLGRAPVNVRAGVGMFARVDKLDRSLVIDGLTGAPAESLGFYHHGALAAGDVARFAGTRWGGVSYVTLAEANLRGVPGATPTDCLAVRVAGSIDGSLLVPLTGAYQATGNGGQAPIIANTGTGLTDYTDQLGSSGGTNNARRGMAYPIVPTSTVWVQSMTWRFAGGGPNREDGMLATGEAGLGHGAKRRRKRLAILDANRQVIAQAITEANVTSADVTLPLSASVKLVQGQLYYMSCLFMDGVQGDEQGISYWGKSNPSRTGWGYHNGTAALSFGSIMLGSKAETGADFDSYPVGRTGAYFHGGSSANNAWAYMEGANSHNPIGSLNGQADGVALTGDILVSLAQLGAGPAGSPGTDLNGRLLIASEGR